MSTETSGDGPSTVVGLFHAVAVPHHRRTGAVYPWEGWDEERGWEQGPDQLQEFLDNVGERAVWADLNGSRSNDGPASVNSDPGRALAERWINGIDAMFELMASMDPDPLPTSPAEAASRYFGISPEAVASIDAWSMTKLGKLAKESVDFRAYVTKKSSGRRSIFDIRDFGIGILPDNFPNTILSLNRSNKSDKPYLTGKHGQGAANTFQFSRLTVIVSRHANSDEIGFTFVAQFWKDPEGNYQRTPTYKYLTLDGAIMRVKASELKRDFTHGTLIRHIGYDKAFSGKLGVDSIYGLTNQMLIDALLPISSTVCFSTARNYSGTPRPPYYPQRHTILGATHRLNRNLYWTIHGGVRAGGTEPVRIRHDNAHSCHLGPHDFGGMDGTVDMGTVRFKFWVLNSKRMDGRTRDQHDTLKSFVDPNRPIIFSLDGQNHAEIPRSLLTAEKVGAGLFAVGLWMVVQVDCNDIHPRVKYELFTSTRERLKKTPIKDTIIKRLLGWISNDSGLRAINVKMASGADRKNSGEREKDWQKTVAKHFKRNGVPLPTLPGKVWGIQGYRGRGGGPRDNWPKKPLAPIEPQNPPTFVRWKIDNKLTLDKHFARVRMYPGQSYAWRFETDAGPAYWHPDATRPASQIALMSGNRVRFTGADSMKGGRVLCRFECSDNAQPGESDMIMVRMYDKDSASLKPIDVAELHIDVVEKAAPRKRPGDGEGEQGKPIYGWVDGVFQILRPEPITRENTEQWIAAGWDDDVERVGFALKNLHGFGYKLFYNAELPDFIDAKRRMKPHGLEESFVENYELALVMHGAMALNNELPDPEAFVDSSDEGGLSADEQRKRLLTYYAAVSQTLVAKAMAETKLVREKERAEAAA